MGFAAIGVAALLVLLLRGGGPRGRVASPLAVFSTSGAEPALDEATFQRTVPDLLARASRGQATERELLQAMRAAGTFGYEDTERLLMMYVERVQRGAYPPALRTLVDRALAQPPPSLLDLQATERALYIANFPATAMLVQRVRRGVEAGRA